MTFKQYYLKRDSTIKDALKRLGESGEKIVFVVGDKEELLGTITDGDIRRWILNDGNLSDVVTRIYNSSPKHVKMNYEMSFVKDMMLTEKIETIPVLNNEKQIVELLRWRDIFSCEFKPNRSLQSVPVLVMAGGKGVRMDPFTRILPKPLIPLGDKPIIEIIMDQFAHYGCNRFYVTVNYKGKMIQAYFDNAECDHSIKYVWEDQPCGTAGGIRLIHDILDAPHLFVSNCDVLVKADYADIYKFHIENNNDITIIGSMKHFSIPYGVLDMNSGGVLKNITEKPEYDFLVNTGMYLIKSSVVQYIPAKTKFDFTELILSTNNSSGKVGVYPVGQHSWIDVGQWHEYHNALEKWSQVSD